jgi:hypothetical protein
MGTVSSIVSIWGENVKKYAETILKVLGKQGVF